MPEPIVTLNEESLKTDLRELVRKTVEDTIGVDITVVVIVVAPDVELDIRGPR